MKLTINLLKPCNYSVSIYKIICQWILHFMFLKLAQRFGFVTPDSSFRVSCMGGVWTTDYKSKWKRWKCSSAWVAGNKISNKLFAFPRQNQQYLFTYIHTSSKLSGFSNARCILVILLQEATRTFCKCDGLGIRWPHVDNDNHKLIVTCSYMR